MIEISVAEACGAAEPLDRLARNPHLSPKQKLAVIKVCAAIRDGLHSAEDRRLLAEKSDDYDGILLEIMDEPLSIPGPLRVPRGSGMSIQDAVALRNIIELEETATAAKPSTEPVEKTPAPPAEPERKVEPTKPVEMEEARQEEKSYFQRLEAMLAEMSEYDLPLVDPEEV